MDNCTEGIIMDIILPETIILKFDRAKIDPTIAELTEDTWCIIDSVLFEIKKGYWTDGKSNPRFFWRVAGSPFTGASLIPSVWHDIFTNTQYFTMNKCNEIYDKMNKYCGVSWSERKAINTGLFFGYRFVYNGKTNEEITGASKHLYINKQQFIP
jgi:hypothetical protein